MSERNLYSGNVSAFLHALESEEATRFVEFGTSEVTCLSELISAVTWAKAVELHCAPTFDRNDSEVRFDSALMSAADRSTVQFNLVKHIGTDTEVNDAILELSESAKFDGAYIAGSSSAEGLLTVMMVCNEALRSRGVLAVADHIELEDSLAPALASFRDMYGDDYEEISPQVFHKY